MRFVLCPAAVLLGQFEGGFLARVLLLLLFLVLLFGRGVGRGYVGDGELRLRQGVETVNYGGGKVGEDFEHEE